jgi:VWFA-related protein
MKHTHAIALIFALSVSGRGLLAQQPDTPQTSSITVHSSLVVVPALVKTKSGQLVFTLKADDFTLTDDGIPQKLRLDDESGSRPLALVVCVELGGDGVNHLADYKNLGPMLGALLGDVDHQVAIVGFDSQPVLLHGFTPNTDFIAKSLDELDPAAGTGDPKKAAILDGIAFSVDQLRAQPTTYRRAVLLLSETIDQGSHTRLEDALRAISDTNTIVYSVAFGSTRAETHDEAAKLSSPEPGPQHGCFSRDFGTDGDGNPIPPPDSKALQDYDCFAELLPPLRLAKMAEIIARNALRRNTAESITKLTGGEFYKFHDVKSLDRDLFTLSNHVPNRYTLSFHPQNPAPGFHAITLQLKDYPQLRVEARNGYWVEPAQSNTP